MTRHQGLLRIAFEVRRCPQDNNPERNFEFSNRHFGKLNPSESDRLQRSRVEKGDTQAIFFKPRYLIWDRSKISILKFQPSYIINILELLPGDRLAVDDQQRHPFVAVNIAVNFPSNNAFIANFEAVLSRPDVFYRQSPSNPFKKLTEQLQRIALQIPYNLKFITRRVTIFDFKGLKRNSCPDNPCPENELMGIAIRVFQDNWLKIRVLEIEFVHFGSHLVVATGTVPPVYPFTS